VIGSSQQFSSAAVKDAEVMREELLKERLSTRLTKEHFVGVFAYFGQLDAILITFEIKTIENTVLIFFFSPGTATLERFCRQI
jgi:predicted AlkP superfamily pyrophosphatase or phosphodiesterase